MNLAENLTRDFPQVVGENFTNEAKERWATDFKILLQRRDVTLRGTANWSARSTPSSGACSPRARLASTRSATPRATPTSSGRWRWRVRRSGRQGGRGAARSGCGWWGVGCLQPGPGPGPLLAGRDARVGEWYPAQPMAGYIPKTIVSLVQPAVYAVAGRLFVLTAGRAGSAQYHPTVATFYETGLVTALYEQLLMSPQLVHLEIRHEMPYPGPTGAPKRVDLWIRPLNGGHPTLIEAGDFGVSKVHTDLAKLKTLNPNGTNWFLAFFRDEQAGTPQDCLDSSFARKNGLDSAKVQCRRQSW